jgi:glutaredoxin
VKAILLAVISLALALPAGAQTDGATSSEAPASKTLTMYATSWCGYCKKARIYFAAKGIAYREVDIDASKENKAEYKQYAGKGVPLFISGEKRMRGFTEARMERFLASTP